MDILVKSALRTLDLLELISTSSNDLSLSDMSKTLGIPVSSMHALLSTMEHRSYLVRDQSTHKYRLGPRFVKLVNTSSIYVDLVHLASPTLDKLQNECEEAITMSVLNKDKIIFISNRSSSSIIRVVNEVGTSLPAHATGSGKVILAYLPAEEIDRIYPQPKLPVHTPKTIGTRLELTDVLSDIRQLGYAYDDGESEEGVWAVASCIRDSVGLPRAAVSIVVPQIRVQEEMIYKWRELVVKYASEISVAMGFNLKAEETFSS